VASFASTIVDLVRAIDATRLANHRAGFGYMCGSDEDRAGWDAECADATRREIAYTIERLQSPSPGERRSRERRGGRRQTTRRPAAQLSLLGLTAYFVAKRRSFTSIWATALPALRQRGSSIRSSAARNWPIRP
jgi:hypothetical protein